MINLEKYRFVVLNYDDTQLVTALSSARDQNYTDRIKLICDEMAKRGVKDPFEAKVVINDDVGYAERYIKKSENAKMRRIQFELTFSEYKRIVTRKNCYYTGIRMTNYNPSLPTHVTIDRIDSALGYTKDNCVGCANVANAIKNAILEDPSAEMLLTIKQFKKMAAKL